MALVSELTWVMTPAASWSTADRCEFKLAAALDTSPARVAAVVSTSWRSELSDGLASSDEKESKKLVMSLPMSPAVELELPESGVNGACSVLSAVRREPEAEANCSQ